MVWTKGQMEGRRTVLESHPSPFTKIHCFGDSQMALVTSRSDWQARYIAAMLERDKARLSTRMNEAERAIFDRLQELSSDKTCEERTALDDAIRGLRVLKKERSALP